MAQHDYVIDNQTFPSYRSDHNSSLQAILTNNSGATAPTTTAAGMWWYDTANGLLKQRNSGDSAWITVFEVGKSGLIPQDGSTIYAADAEASDTYVITLDPVPTAYVEGMMINFKANTANTGACTLNVNGLGAIALKKNVSADLADNDIIADKIVTVIYDGTNFQVVSTLPTAEGPTVVKTDEVANFTKQQYFGVATLTDAANISWNLDDAQSAKVTLGGNRTLDNPTNPQEGAVYILRVIQDGAGSRTLSYGANYKWPGGTAPTLSTGSGAIDILTFVYDGSDMLGQASLDFS